MLSKLKTASVLDDEVLQIISKWFSNYLNKDDTHLKKDLDMLYDRYVSRGLADNKPGNIYRGLGLSYHPKVVDKLLRDGEINLKDTGYDSWSVEPIRAGYYAKHKDLGLVISQKFRGGQYFDINKSLKYIRDQRNIEKREDYLDVYRLIEIYSEQCEIVSLSPCLKCELDKNIECLYLDPSDMHEHLDKFGWKYVEYNGGGGVCILSKRDKSAKFFDDFGQAAKSFILKPDTKCS